MLRAYLAAVGVLLLVAVFMAGHKAGRAQEQWSHEVGLMRETWTSTTRSAKVVIERRPGLSQLIVYENDRVRFYFSKNEGQE